MEKFRAVYFAEDVVKYRDMSILLTFSQLLSNHVSDSNVGKKILKQKTFD